MSEKGKIQNVSNFLIFWSKKPRAPLLCLSVCYSVCLSVCLSVILSVICLLFCLSSVYLYICLSHLRSAGSTEGTSNKKPSSVPRTQYVSIQKENLIFNSGKTGVLLFQSFLFLSLKNVISKSYSSQIRSKFIIFLSSSTLINSPHNYLYYEGCENDQTR